MKYSILVLGASMSISLFIRICCAVKVNSLENIGLFSDFDTVTELNVEQTYSRRAEDVYERFLTLSILNGTINSPLGSLNHVEDVVHTWLDEMDTIRDKMSSRSPAATRNPTEMFGLIGRTRSDFEFQYCGIDEPPNSNHSDCKTKICSYDAELPSGCEYDETLSYMKCKYDITDLPPLPPTLNILDLNETKIQNLAQFAIRNVSINVIRLFRNAIDFIHPWAFHDVQNLKNLLIVDNEITFLAFEIYVGLNQTVFLDLRYNRISFEIYKNCPIRPIEDIMPVLPSLKMLRLSGNPLGVIPKQMFAGLRDSPLYSLYLDDCYLTEIHPEAFSYLKELEVLNLSGNPSTLMNNLGSFLGSLVSLKWLYLTGSRLTRIPTEALSKFSNQLQVLDLSGSILENLSYNDLSTFVALEELYLDESGILSISDNAFAGNVNLKILSLQKNKLRQIPAIFPQTLEYLTLSNVHSTLIRGNQESFKNLTKLRTLMLDGIKLDKIVNDSFVGLTSLTRMFLYNCNIEDIEQGAFKNLTRLMYLSLDNNPISTLNLGAFSQMNRLQQLSMVNCSLNFPIASTSPTDNQSKSMESNEGSLTSFPYIPFLQRLDFTGNKIEYLSPSLFQNLPNLTYLELSNNPIKPWNTRIFPEREHSVYERNAEAYIFQVSLAHGSLQYLTDAMIQDFLRMSTIDLSANKFVCDELACELRDMINASKYSYKQNWIDSDSYECLDIETNSHYHIYNLTDDICQKKIFEPELTTPSVSSASNGLIRIISISASLTVVTAVVIILAYQNRVHLRYFIFVVKLNVMPAPQRKSKLSTMSEEEISYDYDVFISYHHQDSKFVGEVFLPEIELRENQWDEGKHEKIVNEARNTIYFIDNDQSNVKLCNIKSNTIHYNGDSANDRTKSKDVRKFRVCLHERDFAAGVSIADNIVHCVDRSRKTVIFVSKKYMESQWCSYELNLAYHRLVESRRKAFVLVLMEDVPHELRTKVLNYLMASKTYLQWPGMNGSNEEKGIFWKRLRSFLQNVD